MRTYAERKAYFDAYRAAHPDVNKGKYQLYKESIKAYNKLNSKRIREQKSKRRTNVIVAIKLRYGCANPLCEWKGAFKPYMLDFHHIDKETK